MQNPATSDFQRNLRIALVFILLLSVGAAFIHFLLTLDQRMTRQAKQLELKALQLDIQLAPLLKLSEWLQQQAKSQPDVVTALPLTLYNRDGQTLTEADTQQRVSVVERSFLQANTGAFNASRLLYPWLERVLYTSDGGFIYLQPQQLSLLQIQALRPWLAGNVSADNKVVLSKSDDNKLIFSTPLKFTSGETGRLLFVVDIPALLLPLQKVTPEADFLLLDESGQILGGTVAASSQLEQRLLQLQRIGQQPLSLVMLEQRHGLISEGMAGFLGYWFGYLFVLAAALLAFFYRYKQKVLQPLQRLGIHIERLARNQGGVRHIPGGWEEMFDKITRLKP